MLGKLIKYDLKAVSGVLALIHGALLVIALSARMVFIPHMLYIETEESIMSILLFFVLIIALVGTSYATYIFICVRFYKNIYSDEGYLTNTLPVTSGQLLLSKTISGSIWGTINMACIFLSIYLVFIQPIYHASTAEELALFHSIFGFSSMQFSIFFIASLLLSVVANVVMFYFSIILGQLFSAHRIIGAIASYFVLNTVISILSTIVVFLSGNSSLLFATTYNTSSEFLFDYMFRLLIPVDILMFITTAVFYILSFYFMKKKRNLV